MERFPLVTLALAALGNSLLQDQVYHRETKASKKLIFNRNQKGEEEKTYRQKRGRSLSMLHH